jgi:hypothetical protein
MQKVTTIEHGGKVYEVRAIPTLNGWKVRIFVDGIPANGFTYSVDSEVYQDAAIDGVPEDLVAGLLETAEGDFSARPYPGIGDRRKCYRRRYRDGKR